MYAYVDRVHQLALNDDDRFLVLSFFFPIFYVFCVQRYARRRRRERIVSDGKERKKERTGERKTHIHTERKWSVVVI